MLRNNRQGQQVIEYILLFIAVTMIVLIGFGPNGYMTKKVYRSVDRAFNSVTDMAQNIFYNVHNEPWNADR